VPGRHRARRHRRGGRARRGRRLGPRRGGGSLPQVPEGGPLMKEQSDGGGVGGRPPTGHAHERSDTGGVGGRPPAVRSCELVLENVSRWYGNVVAVNGVSMKVGPGVTGLLGPNGAGKSTLIHMMGGFLAPSSGTVTLNGEPIWQNPGVYRSLGLVPERESAYDF